MPSSPTPPANLQIAEILKAGTANKSTAKVADGAAPDSKTPERAQYKATEPASKAPDSPPPATAFPQVAPAIQASASVPLAGAEAAVSPLAGTAAVSQIPVATPPNSSDPALASPAAQLPAPPAAANPAATPDNGTVQNARMVDTTSQTEMHIGLSTPAFGTVEVHTSIRDNQVGVTVGSERGDLRTFLTAEVPSLQIAFRQQDMRFNDFRFLGQNSGTGSGFPGGSGSQPHPNGSGGASPSATRSTGPSLPVAGELEQYRDSPSGLNVHA